MRFFIAAITLALSSGAALAADEARPVADAAQGFTAPWAYDMQRGYDPGKTPAGGDQTVYMYLNMPQFFPHQVVSRSGAILDLQVKLNPKVGQVTLKTALGEHTLDAMLADPRSRVQGYVVIHHGRIVYEKYPGMRPTDNHLWWSSSKVLAGLIAAQLVAEGRLDARKTVDEYLPEFAASGWKGTPIRDVADMASGINAQESTEAYMSPKFELSRLIFAERILTPPAGTPVLTHDEAMLSMTRKRPPGEAYEYSSANTNMLAMVLEKVTGQRFADLVTERIWSRIGAEGDALEGLTPQGNAIAHGMFSSRLRDMARLGVAFTPSGRKGKGPQAVPGRVLEMIQHDGRAEIYPKGEKLAAMAAGLGAAPVAAAWQWDAVFADGDFYKSGFHGQGLYVSPSRDAVVAVFSTGNSPAATGYARAILASGVLGK